MTTTGDEVSFKADENVIKYGYRAGCPSINLLKATKLYILNG